MEKEKFLKVFMVMSILFMLMPVMAMAEKIPVAILRTNADGKTKTLTFTYAERPKVFAKRGQNGIHKLNPLGSPGQEPLPSWYKMPSDGMIDERSVNTVITTVIFDKTFSQARPVTCSMWFYNLKRLTTIKGIENLNTSKVKSMFSMFEGCSSLDSINVSSFETSNVVEMWHMFGGCTKLTDFDVSGFNTNNVTDMSGMFEGCSNLLSIDVTGFNTEKVKSTGGMFKGCSSLLSIDISNFNLHNKYWVDDMFSGCIGLRKIYVGNNDFTNISDFSQSVKAEDQRNSAFQKVGTADNPCLLIIGSDFNKSVLGVKHDNGKGGFYRWLDGYFTLTDTGQNASTTNIQDGNEEIYSEVDEAPSFIGDNYKYYVIIHSDKITHGFIQVKVVIEKDGSITNPEILKSDDETANDTALQRLKLMPKWKPGMKDGQPVRCHAMISFIVTNLI